MNLMEVKVAPEVGNYINPTKKTNPTTEPLQ